MKIYLPIIIGTVGFCTVKGAQDNRQFCAEKSIQTGLLEKFTVNFKAELSQLNKRVLPEKMASGLVTNFVACANKLNQIGDMNLRSKLQ